MTRRFAGPPCGVPGTDCRGLLCGHEAAGSTRDRSCLSCKPTVQCCHVAQMCTFQFEICAHMCTFRTASLSCWLSSAVSALSRKTGDAHKAWASFSKLISKVSKGFKNCKRLQNVQKASIVLPTNCLDSDGSSRARETRLRPKGLLRAGNATPPKAGYSPKAASAKSPSGCRDAFPGRWRTSAPTLRRLRRGGRPWRLLRGRWRRPETTAARRRPSPRRASR